MVKCKPGKGIQRVPCRLYGVVRGAYGGCVLIYDTPIRDANRPAARVAPGVAICVQLFEGHARDPGFLPQFPFGAGLQGFAFIEESAGQRPIAAERFVPPANKQHVRFGIDPREQDDVRRNAGTRIVVSVLRLFGHGLVAYLKGLGNEHANQGQGERNMANADTAASDYFVDAVNYATDSENRMHNDDTAPKYGFRGGLVPGIGVYGYMNRAMVESLGSDWLTRGRTEVRFLKPVYDGERVCVQSAWDDNSNGVVKVSLMNPDGVLCGAGTASLVDAPATPTAAAYSMKSVPDYESRPDASLDALPAGSDLGAFEVELDADTMAEFVQSMCETSPALFTKATACHPAYYPSLANEILVRNVALGPWIHAGSAVQHFATPELGTTLLVQGRVEEAYERKGHEMVVLDVCISANNAPVATVQHTAIIRPRVAA